MVRYGSMANASLSSPDVRETHAEDFLTCVFVSNKSMQTKKRLTSAGDKSALSSGRFRTGSLGHKVHYWDNWNLVNEGCGLDGHKSWLPTFQCDSLIVPYKRMSQFVG